MKMTKPNLVRFVCCLLAFGAALVWPVQRICQFERSKDYTLHRFKVTLYDPYDLMRGHYLRLGVVSIWRSDREFKDGPVWVTLGRDGEGFAQVKELSKNPRPGAFRAKCYSSLNRHWSKNKWVNDSREKWRHTILYPFDRYFINEKIAAEAEALVANAVRAKRPAEIRVRIYRNGSTMIEELRIDGRPIGELLRESPKKPATPSNSADTGRTK